MLSVNRARAWLKSRWHVTVPDDWLTACIEWIDSENEGLPLQHNEIHQMVYEQWLASDLHDLGSSCLPPDLDSQMKVVLPGNYSLQVDSLVDISQPYYGQLLKVKGTENPNVLVSAATQQSQPAWEAKPTRMMLLSMTDGTQQVKGMEYRPIPTLSPDLSPGTKVVVRGEVICRKGVLMLKAENLSVMGGEVESLLEENTPEANIKRALDHNTNLGEDPRTERKEFAVDTRPKNRGPPAKSRLSASRAPATGSAHPASTNVNSNRNQAHADDWGDDDMDIDGHLAQMETQWDDNREFEAMMEDVDHEMLASHDDFQRQQEQPKHNQASVASTARQQEIDERKRAAQQRLQLSRQRKQEQQNLEHEQRRREEAQREEELKQRQLEEQIQEEEMIQEEMRQEERRGQDLGRRSTLGNKRPRVAIESPDQLQIAKSSRIDTSFNDSFDDFDAADLSAVASNEFKEEPFTYLSRAMKTWPPASRRYVKVKAYIGTLLDSLKSNSGKFWSLKARINDGTATADVRLGDQMLTSLIGFSAQECMEMRARAKVDKEAKGKLTTGVRSCQEKLIRLSAILLLLLDPNEEEPVVICHFPVTPDVLTALKERIT